MKDISLSNQSNQKLQNYFFTTLIFLFPSQLAYHFWPDWALVRGLRIDYLSPTIFLTDIILLGLLLLWFFEDKARIRTKKSTLAIIFFALINTFASAIPVVALIKWIRVFAMGLFAAYVARRENVKLLVRPLVFSLVLFGVIGLSQFLLGRTLGGVFSYLGERSFDTTTPAIALHNIGKVFLRPYSTFGHPNSFAGFVALSSMIIFSLTKNRTLRVTTLVVAVIVLVITFSKSVLLFIPLFFLAKLLKVNSRVWLLFLVAASLSSPLLVDIFRPENVFTAKSLVTRLQLARRSGEIFSMYPTIGAGLNNFIVQSTEIAKGVNQVFQPVHNVFLLILSETGMIGLLLVYCLMNKLHTKSTYLSAGFSLIVFTGTLDHYWFTLQQNTLLAALFIGLVIRSTRRDKMAS